MRRLLWLLVMATGVVTFCLTLRLMLDDWVLYASATAILVGFVGLAAPKRRSSGPCRLKGKSYYHNRELRTAYRYKGVDPGGSLLYEAWCPRCPYTRVFTAPTNPIHG